jgi:hypothetical protein
VVTPGGPTLGSDRITDETLVVLNIVEQVS